MHQISSINASRGHVLSGVRIMWMLVMFDLPVGTPAERKAATRFRNNLLEHGFQMAQFSVYYKLAGTREKADRLAGKIEQLVPEAGLVNILTITDKQYENMVCVFGQRRKPVVTHQQLSFF
ncbi:CRISPR-associated endonuclease Cas2 [Oleidesulfovibrio sp.]|uniref:CRISPR-associated endonuclease Cas2 n=1 Tax=Oleidesulfovibrio sp. TaxID=2909707 RepID=UPI003A8846DE